MPVNTYTPSGSSTVALTPVARTLSIEASWISFATVPILTMFTCGGCGAGESENGFTHHSISRCPAALSASDCVRDFLTLPPVVSASLPMSAKQQSVPSKVITDIITLGEGKKEKIFYSISAYSLNSDLRSIPMALTHSPQPVEPAVCRNMK